MNENTAQRVAVAVGVALIALYSGLMIATDGTSGWSWVLLVAGIGSLLGGARLLRRHAEPWTPPREPNGTECSRWPPRINVRSVPLTRFPYPRFLLWDTIGGIAWASFTCLSSALVATAIGGQPVLSLIISIGITTALLAFLYRRVRTSWEQPKADMALES